MEQKIDKQKLYTSMHDFFKLKGSVVMYIARAATIEVCRYAMDYDILIWRLEGGIWHNPGFQPSIDALWDAQCNPPTSREEAIKSNIRAVENIIEEEDQYNVYSILIANYQGLPEEHLYDKYFEKHPHN